MLRTFLDVGLVFFFVMLHYVGVALVILGHVIFMIFLAMLWAFEEGGGVLARQLIFLIPPLFIICLFLFLALFLGQRS